MDMMYDSHMPEHSMDTNDMMHTNHANDMMHMRAGHHMLADVSMPDMTDGFCGGDGFGGYDLPDGADSPTGNSEDLLMYPDPLGHAQEFQPDPFLYPHDGWNGEAMNDTADAPAVSYITNAHGGIMPAFSDVDDLPGVEHGMLTDSSQLQQIIDMGEIDGAQHIQSDDIVRSEEMKQAFLHQHGYTEVPAGYEVHHIVPLSEGGADDPQNMILLSDMDHKAVTDAQHLYYGW